MTVDVVSPLTSEGTPAAVARAAWVWLCRRPGAVAGVLVAAATGVAAALRLADLTAAGLGGDEAVYAAQARALAGGQVSIRAHPPLVAAVAALLGDNPGEMALRVLGAAAGVLAVVLAARLAMSLPTPAPRAAGVVAAWVIALMPYHVDVSRQFGLDGPAATACAAMLLSAMRWQSSGRRAWLWATGGTAAIAVLVKESSLLIVAVIVLAAAVAPTAARVRAAAVAAGSAALAVGAWAVTSALSGQAGRLAAYAEWQVARAPNAPATAYLQLVLPAVGPAVVLAALVGAAALLRRRQGLLLVLAVLVPVAFFQLWPVKGYAYLAIVVPTLAALASAGGVVVVASARTPRAVVAAVLVGVCVATSVAGAAVSRADGTPVPGRDGLPAVREAAQWIERRPSGGVLAAGTAVGNVVSYYARADVAVIGHGTGDARLNPAYRDSTGPGGVTPRFLIWDAWTAQVQPDRADALIAEARELGARVGFTGLDGAGTRRRPVIVVYEVAP